MIEILSIMPVSFWVVIAFLIGGGMLAWSRMADGTGLPIMAVLGTVAAWYVGDAFYNDYPNHHVLIFEPGILDSAWWQVAWFILVLIVITPYLHDWINRPAQTQGSGVLQLFKNGVNQPIIQKQINSAFKGSVGVWLFLLLIALAILKDQIIYYIFPFLGYQASPWAHGQIGGGFDCLSVLAIYLQLLSATIFGVVLAMATNRRIQALALVFCLASWPYFIFSRTRNQMLALIIPAILCWVFLRLRGGMWKKLAVLGACFLVINVWMKFVIANRSHMSITAAFQQKGLNLSEQKKVHNEGLNMYEELCWISTFIEDGRYRVNWGQRYFAELVNPIPRGLWKGKPLIGLDYALARGHHITGANGMVDTTISTGMIGQGVVNFGRILGPAAAAVLMSLWVVWLARMDLQIRGFGRLPLYSLGMILTFNLGRDITLITIYPLLFGALLVYWVDRRQSGKSHMQEPVRRAKMILAASGHVTDKMAAKPGPRLTFAVSRRSRFVGGRGTAQMQFKQTRNPAP